MSLNVLISTIDDRIEQVESVILERREDLKYIISHQYTDTKFIYVPNKLVREDVVISRLQGKGVARSRNNVIKLADADIVLFSDDDVKYTHEYFDKIIKIFSDDPLLDVGVFKIKTPEGDPEYKKYPSKAMKLKRLPFSVGTIEIACRIERVREFGIWFDERFGLGNNFLVGSEESIFIIDCIKAGLNVWFYPEYIVQHPFISTIKSVPKYDIRKVSMNAAYDARINGWMSVPKVFIRTMFWLPDLIRHKKNVFAFLNESLKAVFFILTTKPNNYS